MAEDDFEKTEDATPRRRQEAREEGQVARSTDLVAALVLLATVMLLHKFGSKIFVELCSITETSLSARGLDNPTRPDDMVDLQAMTISGLMSGTMPFLLGLGAVALVATAGQVGFVLTTKPLEPKWSRLSMISGLQQLFDGKAGVKLIMTLAKLGLIGGLAAVLIYHDLPAILKLVELEVAPLMAAACHRVYLLALKLAAALLILAILDFAYQRYHFEHGLRMSKFEIKEEMKRMEGDPLVKQRRMRVARQLAMQRLNQAVPKADVIVTNPTHFAIALQYDGAKMKAPKVVAKGADLLAMRIRQLAAQHGIPMVERKPLAQALYKSVDVGQEVPAQFYSAVAEILAYVYRLSGRKSA